jgi:rhomboid family GlyGly-CTERM serine protease
MEKPSPVDGGPHVALPWVTAIILGGAIVATAWPAAVATLEFERDRVMAGELWRLWTAHLVHFGWSHAGWNALVFALTGGWAERLMPARTRLLYAVAAPVIGLALLIFAPALQRYAGLSGVAAATVALLALSRLNRPEPGERWFWRMVLVALLAKMVFELASGQPVFARFADTDIHTVPLAHLAGVLVAVALPVPSRATRVVTALPRSRA